MKTTSSIIGRDSNGNIRDVLQELDEIKQTLSQPLLNLEQTPWEVVDVLAQNDLAPVFFKVGDEKTVTLEGGEKLTFVILGFYHDDLRDGGKAKITFGMKDLMSTRYSMSEYASSGAWWRISQFRTSALASIAERFPSEVINIVKTVYKKSAVAETTILDTTEDDLFLFSAHEILRDSLPNQPDDGDTYDYWLTRNAGSYRIKRVVNGEGEEWEWWLRSAEFRSANNYAYISVGGDITYGNESWDQGICLGFCI